MSKYDFSEIKDSRKKKLYSKMWEDFDFGSLNGAEIERTESSKSDDGESKNSYSFKVKDKKEEIIKIFGIENKDRFRTKYEKAVNGSGQEERRITTLHSSSLCALLHFYNVTDKNPLALHLETNKGTREVIFTDSFFEYQSPVIHTPSNMDVVLLGKDKQTKEDIVLFLESKFSEYFLYAGSTLDGVSNDYLKDKYGKDLYDDSFLSALGLKRGPSEKKDCFKLVSLSKGQQIYIGGIKQMISHYIGIRNLLEGKYIDNNKPINKKIKGGATVLLGEICFDGPIGKLKFGRGGKGEECGKAYADKYKILAEKIGEFAGGIENFEILKEELGYSLFDKNKYKIDKNVKKFYGHPV